MPRLVPIQAVRSQRFDVLLNNIQHNVRIYNTSAGMVMDLTRDEVLIFGGIRVIADAPLIPFEYLESGNLILTVNEEALPDYNQFGTTQILLYFTAEEMAAFRGV